MTRLHLRPLARPAVLIAVAALIGGLLGAAVAVAAVVAVAVGLAARRVLFTALAAVVLAMLSWVVGNAGAPVSFTVVTEHPWPHRFALAAVVLLLVGVFVESPKEEAR
ncbi:MAG: hypothetical protein KDB63_18905 [Nocardioidaceae bacterium]|nr:hypothetical protein [Nocardioidaceae bacterium]